jgi:transcriptional regulator with XRE-family HTH domain
MRDQEHITPIDQYLIDFIRELRNKKDLTQDDLGNIIGISRSYISDIESINSRAKYNLKHINSLADYFEMSPRDFLPEKPLALKYIVREKVEAKKIKKGKAKS